MPSRSSSSPAASLTTRSTSAAGKLLDRSAIFDVFRGEQLGAGRKSLALRLEFRSPQRTLTDEDVTGARTAIEAELEKIGGGLRA